MKKKMMVLLVAMLGVISLTACGGESFTCDLCGEEKTGKKYTSSTDEDMTVCEDCVDMVNELFNNL